MFLTSSIKNLFLYTLSLFVLSILSGCVSGVYVDPIMKEKAQYTLNSPVHPKPVNIMFEFQTNGKANHQATAFLKEQVITQIKTSGLFSDIDTKEGALLVVVLNNVADLKEAGSKGFVTGLTFGAKGTAVTDQYICTIKLSTKNEPQIIKTATHAIHTTIGAKTAPVDVEREPSSEAAVRKMTKEIIHSALYDLSIDQEFLNEYK